MLKHFVLAFVLCLTYIHAQRDGHYYKINIPSSRISELPPQDQDFFVQLRGDDHVEAYADDAHLLELIKAGFDVENVTEHHKRSVKRQVSGWPSNQNMFDRMEALAAKYPQLTKLFSVGKSVGGIDLMVLEISNNPGDRTENKPDFKYIANMHGDETVGRELCMLFMEYVLENYGKIPVITRLVDDTHMFIMPTMNPDGFNRGRRANNNGYDLNRNFPDQFRDPNNSPNGRQPETQAVMKWTMDPEYKFALSANFHGGALCANYAYDCNAEGQSGRYTPTPDDALFIKISLAYSKLNPPMYRSTQFKDGITNGAAWYCLFGGMQDWNYVYEDCLEVTMEVSVRKAPPYSQMDTFWDENRDSMIAYASEIFTAIQGTVFKSGTQTVPKGAEIKIKGNNKNMKVHKGGMFYRMVLPGKYTIQATAPGCQSEEAHVTVSEQMIAKHQFNLECA